MALFHLLFGTSPERIVWWQMCARAVLIILFAIALLRLASRRITGRDTILDIIIAVILGSTFSRALTGNSPLLPVLTATTLIVIMHGMLSGLAARFDWVAKLIKGRGTRIVEEGRVDWATARRLNVGEEDLREELRLHGISDIKNVRAAYLERNGSISFIRR